MAIPDLPTIVGQLPTLKADIDSLFAALEKLSPDAAKGGEEALKLEIEAAVSTLNLDGIKSSLAAAIAVVEAGGGPLGKGADADLA